MASDQAEFDVVVVGAGLGGIYATYRMHQLGFRTLCLEAACGIGGVWHHNRYPGARVDVESVDYCYQFDEDLYRSWQWSERFAAQPEILNYLNHAVDFLGIRHLIRLNTRMESARWMPEESVYSVVAGGLELRTRFLVMATGNLSQPRVPDIPGLSAFRNPWVVTSAWPDAPVEVRGKRVGVLGTGSSGVQVVAAIASEVAELTVFQRTPNYSVPARNGRTAQSGREGRKVAEVRDELWQQPNPVLAFHPGRPMATYSPEDRLARLEEQWAAGAHEMALAFSDQATDAGVNQVVSDFVREKIRQVVADPDVAEALCPLDHPIGTRRLIIDTGYYECFNRANVHLVDLRQEPLLGFTGDGLETASREYELDLMVFATGFDAFTGSLVAANVSNDAGDTLCADWDEGPRTFFGLMSDRFPNLFFLTGPGSPSVLANLFPGNELHVEWVGELLEHMREAGLATVVPTSASVEAWGAVVARAAEGLLRVGVSNYMVHVAPSGRRVFMPWAGGFGNYAERLQAMTDNGYAGLAFDAI